MPDYNYCPECNVFLPSNPHKPLCPTKQRLVICGSVSIPHPYTRHCKSPVTYVQTTEFKEGTEKMKIYVAVVIKPWANPGSLQSGRNDGDWAAFVDKNKKEAIRLAIGARDRYEKKGYGPYQIWVGELRENVVVPTNYELTELVTES